MKKVLGVVLCIGFLSIAAPARADKVLIAAATSDTSSAVVPIGPATKVTISIKSAAGSVCVVTIKQKLPSDTTYFTAATIINPTSTGEVWQGPGGGQLQISITGYGGGTITVNGEAWAGMNQLF